MVRSRTMSLPGARPGRKRAPIFPGDHLDRLLVAALARVGTPLSAYDLGEVVRAERGTANVTAIYRSLERLCGRGTVQRVASLSSYRLCDRPGAALVICRACGVTESIPVGDTHDRLLGDIAASGFSGADLIIEAMGVCARCREG